MKLAKDVTEAAEHWRKLAKAQLDRLKWDKHLLPAVAHARAATYEDAAKSIELTAQTGIFHCACHLLPPNKWPEPKKSR